MRIIQSIVLQQRKTHIKKLSSCCLILHTIQQANVVQQVGRLNKWVSIKLWLHEGDNLDERIVTISCNRVHGATQARPCETSCCLRLRCTVKVSNKTRLFRSHEQLRCSAKKLSLPAIGRCCRRWRFWWDFPPVANGQENVRLSREISLVCNSSTIQPANSPSCGWSLRDLS